MFAARSASDFALEALPAAALADFAAFCSDVAAFDALDDAAVALPLAPLADDAALVSDCLALPAAVSARWAPSWALRAFSVEAVSYTHLTLPTSDLG